VVTFLVGQMVASGRLSAESIDRVVAQVLRREAVGSTGVGHAVAVPHAKSDAVSEVLGIVGRLPAPLAWPGAVDDQPVRVVCLLITPASDPGASLRALEAVARRLRAE
jgi:mannitol/fructose-specific phosphotransferase system IIA component (Ntr-type)